MSADGHRPIRSTDAETGSLERAAIEEAAVVAPAEPVVLPYYRPPRAAAGIDGREAFAPGDSGSQPVRDAGEASFGETALLRAVIGNDDRVRLADPLTRTNPWRQICAL